MIYTVYRVLPGDTLGKISSSNGISLGDLLEINPQIENADLIQVGEPINVPVKNASEIEFDEDIKA
jgi:LysM repeat protein